MSDLPILFSAPMIRAILEGRKTQTRRILKPQPDDLYEGQIPRQLRIAVGDRLWTRETLRFDWKSKNWQYDADKADCVEVVGTELETPTSTRWPLGVCVSIHQPRHLSRITLLVVEVKVEQLQDISSADTIAEGVQCPTCQAMNRSACSGLGCFASREAFSQLWQSINGPGSWDANPWVAVIAFDPIFKNIDEVK